MKEETTSQRRTATRSRHPPAGAGDAEEVPGERRLRSLQDLATLTAGAKSTEEACRQVARAIDGNPADLPFALLYLAGVQRAQLGCAVRVDAGSAFAPEVVDLTGGAADPWGLADVLRTGSPRVVEDLSARFGGAVPTRDGAPSPGAALLLPISLPGEARPAAALIAGLSPRLELDDRYRGFLGLVAGLLGGVIASARAQDEARRRAGSTDGRLWGEITAILRQIPVAMALISFPERRYDFVNEAHVKIAGRDQTGMALDDALSELSEHQRSKYKELQDRVMASSQPISLSEVPRTMPDGSVRYYNTHLRAWLDQQGGTRGLISVSMDVTEQVMARRQAEESREQISRSETELRKAMALRDDFLTLASHELRTPLTTLGLEAEGLLRMLRGAPPGDPSIERWEHKAARLSHQAGRLEQLIEGMLDVIALGREPTPTGAEELDLAEIARAVVARFHGESKQARAILALHAEPVIGRWNRRYLEKILTQLVSNALKFGADRPVEVRVLPAGDLARVCVQDRGIGIHPDDQQRIFGRYERAASADHYGGFGLGLWMVDELVKTMRGAVRVESKLGEGSTFILDLPRRA